MEEIQIKFVLLLIIIPLAYFKIHKFYKKLVDLSGPTIKEKLEELYKR